VLEFVIPEHVHEESQDFEANMNPKHCFKIKFGELGANVSVLLEAKETMKISITNFKKVFSDSTFETSEAIYVSTSYYGPVDQMLNKGTLPKM
jgi:hypothetical protein